MASGDEMDRRMAEEEEAEREEGADQEEAEEEGEQEEGEADDDGAAAGAAAMVALPAPPAAPALGGGMDAVMMALASHVPDPMNQLNAIQAKERAAAAERRRYAKDRERLSWSSWVALAPHMRPQMSGRVCGRRGRGGRVCWGGAGWRVL